MTTTAHIVPPSPRRLPSPMPEARRDAACRAVPCRRPRSPGVPLCVPGLGADHHRQGRARGASAAVSVRAQPAIGRRGPAGLPPVGAPDLAHPVGRDYREHGSHLALLQWTRRQGCPWDADTCSMAARGGHLALLQWVSDNGCPWDAGTCSQAARGGHLSSAKKKENSLHPHPTQFMRAAYCECEPNAGAL